MACSRESSETPVTVARSSSENQRTSCSATATGAMSFVPPAWSHSAAGSRSAARTDRWRVPGPSLMRPHPDQLVGHRVAQPSGIAVGGSAVLVTMLLT